MDPGQLGAIGESLNSRRLASEPYVQHRHAATDPSRRPASSCRSRRATRRRPTPALRNASILSPAPPLPPAMIAPAWPIRRPGGAVLPAMNPTTGFLRSRRLQKIGAVLLRGAADLADHDDGLGLVIGEKHFEHLDKIGAVDRVAADPDAARSAPTRLRSSAPPPHRSRCPSARRCRSCRGDGCGPA